ncbi:MAG: ABC transporter permease [Alphaproteobacteria bacterium]
MNATYLARRLLLAIPTLAGVAVIVFVLLRVVPGDPIAMMIPPGAGEDDIERLRALYGLDLPIWQQFLAWLGDVAVGDFGTSISLRQNVLGLVLSRLPATLELAAVAMLLALAIGLTLGLVATRWRGHWPEAGTDGIVGLALAVPDFLWALVFVLLLGVAWPVLPISGRLDPRLGLEFTTSFYLIESLVTGRFAVAGMLLSHLLLPATALALPLASVIARVLKTSMAEVMGEDYILMARVKGFGAWRVILGEALRNALIPTVTLSGVQFTFLVGGTVLIERIFSYPGIGNMAIGAVIERDLPLIQGLILTFAVLFIAVNLIIDMAMVWLDPRVRHG